MVRARLCLCSPEYSWLHSHLCINLCLLAWPSSSFSATKRCRNHHLHRRGQANYRRENDDGDEVRVNEGYEDHENCSTVQPLEGQLLPDDGSENTYEAIGSSAANARDNRAEDEAPREPHYATPKGIRAPQPMTRKK